MKINFIGIGGAFYNELGCNAAYIKEDNKILFIDLGMDTFDKIIKYNLLENVNEVYVAITHMHGDHIGGLPTFVQYCFIALNIRVKIFINSDTFKEDLNTILKLTAVENTNYEFIDNKEFDMSFDIEFKLTKHTKLLECYSLIFTKDNKKTLYTGDSNDIEFLKEAILNENYEDIYSEIGDYAPVHMDYNEVIKLDLSKVTLMHIESKDLHNRLIEKKLRIADYLK